MIKFKKLFSIKIISLAVAITFTVTSTCYGLELSNKSHLRTKLMGSTKEGRGRLKAALDLAAKEGAATPASSLSLDELMRYSSIGGSALSHELVFNIKGSDSKDPKVVRDEDLRNMQVIAVESTLDPEFFGEDHTARTLLFIDTEKDEVVGYAGVTTQEGRITVGSSRVFDSFRNHGYMERAVKLLLLSRQIEELFSSYSLEKPAERMYQRIRGDSRFTVTSLKPSGYLVRLKTEQVAEAKAQVFVQRETKQAIYERFSTTSERKEALRLVRSLAITLADKGIDPGYTLEYAIPEAAKAAKNIEELKLFIALAKTLVDKGISPGYTLRYAIPAIARVAQNIDELKETLPSMENLATTLADKVIDSYYALRHTIPKAAEAAKNIEELKLFIGFAIALADKGIDPGYTLEYTIPAAARVAQNIDELKEVLPFIEALAKTLADKGISPGYTLRYAIPAIARVAQNIEELKETLPSIENLVTTLANKRIYPRYTLEYAIPEAAEAAKNIDELKLFIGFATTLADKGIDPRYTLRYAIPKVAGVAKNIDELKEILPFIEALARTLANERMDPDDMLQYAIPEAAKNIEELKLFIVFATTLADKGIDPGYALEYAIPAVAGVAKNIEELRYICNNVIPKIPPSMIKLITGQDIRDALGFLRQYGDFRVEILGASESFLILPPSSSRTQAKSDDIEPPSVGHVEPVADAYTALQAGRHDEAYDLVLEGLLGEDAVVNMDTAIGVLKALVAHYGVDTDKGKELSSISEIVSNYKTATDQREMKAEIRQAVGSQEIAEAQITNLSTLKTTPVLFIDTDILKNPSGFEEALLQLKPNENIPVILLTENTEADIRSMLTGMDLTGAEFRTLAELGLQDFKLDEVMSLIVEIEDLQSIPLTDLLCDTYEALKKARDQV